MKVKRYVVKILVIFIITAFSLVTISFAAEKMANSYSPVVITKPFSETMSMMKADKPNVMKRQMDLLNMRYDLSDKPATGVTMSQGKAIQSGVRAKLSRGMTWDKLGQMSPVEIKKKDVFPKGFLPLPHPNQKDGGMVFPKYHIKEIKKQTGRDLERFDLDLDLPLRWPTATG